MSIALLIKFVHVLSAMGLIGGLLGRGLTLRQAQRSSDIRVVAALTQLSGCFERLLVIPCSYIILLFGVGTALLAGWPLFGFLQGAQSNWLFVSLLLFLSMIPLIAFVFVPRGKIFGQALEDALRRESVTPELRAAFADRFVAAARTYELAVIFVVVTLMITKPF